MKGTTSVGGVTINQQLSGLPTYRYNTADAGRNVIWRIAGGCDGKKCSARVSRRVRRMSADCPAAVRRVIRRIRCRRAGVRPGCEGRSVGLYGSVGGYKEYSRDASRDSSARTANTATVRRLSADYEGWSEGYNSLRVCHGCSRMRLISRRV